MRLFLVLFCFEVGGGGFVCLCVGLFFFFLFVFFFDISINYIVFMGQFCEANSLKVLFREGSRDC